MDRAWGERVYAWLRSPGAGLGSVTRSAPRSLQAHNPPLSVPAERWAEPFIQWLRHSSLPRAWIISLAGRLCHQVVQGWVRNLAIGISISHTPLLENTENDEGVGSVYCLSSTVPGLCRVLMTTAPVPSSLLRNTETKAQEHK